MLTTKLAKKKLTKKEQKHLSEVGIHSMAAFERQIAFMRKTNPDSPGSICWDCWSIGRKLGLVKDGE